MGIGYSIFLVTEEYAILGSIGLIITIIGIIPLNLLVKRYCSQYSYQEKHNQINQKYIFLGQLVLLAVILFTFLIHYGPYNFASKPLLVIGLVAFNGLLVLEIWRRSLK